MSRILLFIISCFILSKLAVSSELPMDRGEVMDALKASFEAMDNARIVVDKKDIEIKFENEMIVIYFINRAPMFGGQARVVYDPSKNRVVRIVGEQ